MVCLTFTMHVWLLALICSSKLCLIQIRPHLLVLLVPPVLLYMHMPMFTDQQQHMIIYAMIFEQKSCTKEEKMALEGFY